MKYLFLDIDGVLNHADWYDKIRKCPELCPGPFPLECFDPDCVRRVNEILESTGARLVISSSWRFDNKLCKTFQKVGLPMEFDVTPAFDIYSLLTDFCRGDEIKAFLDGHPCEQYVIIDDDSDMLQEQIKHFVQTAAYVDMRENSLYRNNDGSGLTAKVKENVIRLLSDGER